MKNTLIDIFKDKKAVLFDLDGTVIDSMWMWKDVDVTYLSKRNIEYPLSLPVEIEGKTYYETAVYFKERFNLPDTLEEIMDEWHEISYDIYCNKVMLKDKVKDVLITLKEKGYKTAIATSNSRALTKGALESLGIYELFDTLVCSEDVKCGKPDPEVYMIACKNLGVLGSEAVVFEDVPQGLIAGSACGCKTVAVFDEYSKMYDEEKHKLADYYLMSYSEMFTDLFERQV